MTGWADEIQTSVNAQVDLLLADWLLFLEHVGFVLVVKELDDGLPGIAVVHVITEARSVNDSEADCNASVIANIRTLVGRTLEELLL